MTPRRFERLSGAGGGAVRPIVGLSVESSFQRCREAATLQIVSSFGIEA